MHFEFSPPSQTVLELHVASADLERFTALFEQLDAEGITFTTLRQLQREDAKWLERFTCLDNETRASNGDPCVPRSLADMPSRITRLGLVPDACFVALADNRWVGYTVVDAARSSAERLQQSWTGVLPEYRRRGIATALKVLTVRYALQRGYLWIVTATKSSNVASVALSRRVGFHPRAE